MEHRWGHLPAKVGRPAVNATSATADTTAAEVHVMAAREHLPCVAALAGSQTAVAMHAGLQTRGT